MKKGGHPGGYRVYIYIIYIYGMTWKVFRDYIISHDIRIPIKQSGFHGKYPRFFSCLMYAEVQHMPGTCECPRLLG